MVSDWIPIVAMTLSLGGVVAIVVAALYYDYRKRNLQHQEIVAAIEKGIEVPLPKTERRERDYRRLGIIWTLLGVAFTIVLGTTSYHHFEGAVWGLLPVALGVAFLLIAYFAKKDEQNGDDS
jgi:O-antigen/teichoic acid export membrane protein